MLPEGLAEGRCTLDALLSHELVVRAIEMGLPLFRAMIAHGGTWGPEGVVIGVDGPGLEEAVVYVMQELGPEDEWPAKWGRRSFRDIVREKLNTASTGVNSVRVVNEEPWLLLQGDSLYQGGVVKGTNGELRAAASGAYGQTDHAIAEITLDLIAHLCRLEVRRLQEEKINVIE